MLHYTFRKATQSDLPNLTEIYNQAINARQTADTLPLTTADRMSWFQTHQNPQYPLFVAVIEEEILGYATLSQYRGGRPALRYTVEVSYYIDKKYQRKGLGSALLTLLLEKAKNLGFKHAFALLLDSNTPSTKLLEKYGFVRWGHLPNIAEIDERTCGQFIYGKHL